MNGTIEISTFDIEAVIIIAMMVALLVYVIKIYRK